jgi:hypothetical protein
LSYVKLSKPSHVKFGIGSGEDGAIVRQVNANLYVLFAILTAVIIIAVFSIRGMSYLNPNIRGPALTGTALVLSVKRDIWPPQRVRRAIILPLRIGLRVEVPGRQPYDVKVRRYVNAIHVVGRLRTGATVPVRVDATHPQKLRLDFDLLTG